MNWKRAKTLFIFVFILVNILLLTVYINKVNHAHINEIDSANQVDFEQEDITLPNQLQAVKGVEMQLLTGRSKDFTDYAKPRSSVSSEDSGYTINVDISDSISVKNDDITKLNTYIRDNVYKGNQYQLKEMDDKRIVFEQTYNSYAIMDNNKSMLTFTVDDGKVTKYKQTAMEKIEPSEGSNNEKKKVISPKKALESLYFNRYLKRGDTVTNVRLGYYSVVKETNVQVLQGYWEVKVKHANKEKVYYVEATATNPKIVTE